MKNAFSTFCVTTAMLVSPTFATAAEFVAASRIAALLEATGSIKSDPSTFKESVFRKATRLESRERVLGWISDSTEKRGIACILEFGGDGGFTVSIKAAEKGRIYSARVHFVFNPDKTPKAVFASFTDLGPY